MASQFGFAHANRDIFARLGLSSMYRQSDATRTLTALLEAFHTLWHSASSNHEEHFRAARKRIELIEHKPKPYNQSSTDPPPAARHASHSRAAQSNIAVLTAQAHTAGVSMPASFGGLN